MLPSHVDRPRAAKGSAETLILALLEERDRHGYEIAKLIDERSDGAITFHVASLYPTLYRLERRGLIQGRWSKGRHPPPPLLSRHAAGRKSPRRRAPRAGTLLRGAQPVARDHVMHDWRALVRARIGELPLDPARAADIVDELARHVAQHHADLVSSGVKTRPMPCERRSRRSTIRARVAAEIARADRPRPPAPLPPAATGSPVVDLGRDVRYAARLLRAHPASPSSRSLTLALGIGANTAIFSVLNAVLLRPLPLHAIRTARRWSASADRHGIRRERRLRHLSRLARSRPRFERDGADPSWSPTLFANGQAERVSGMRVAANFFHTLGVKPAIGRDFCAAEDTPARLAGRDPQRRPLAKRVRRRPRRRRTT